MASSILKSAHPPELILCIADYLPISSVSGLALSNRSLGNLLGPRAWEALKTESRRERIQFLSLLSRDLPHHYACLHGCIKLHLCSKVIWPNSLGNYEEHGCAFESRRFIARRRSPYMITATHIQLALKRHNYGAQHGIPLDAFSHTEIEQMPNSIFTELLSVECRIASGELLLRSQRWVQFPTDQLDELFSRNVFTFPCEHMGGFMRDGKIEYRKNENSPSTFDDRLSQCSICRMEFQINFQDLGSGKIAASVTRWANLGSGTVPLVRYSNVNSRGFLGAMEGNFIPGTIRQAFEAQKGLSLVQLTRQNKHRLLLEKQRGSRTRFGWTRSSDKTQWYFRNLKEREIPTSIIGSIIRWASDWVKGIF